MREMAKCSPEHRVGMDALVCPVERSSIVHPGRSGPKLSARWAEECLRPYSFVPATRENWTTRSDYQLVCRNTTDTIFHCPFHLVSVR